MPRSHSRVAPTLDRFRAVALLAGVMITAASLSTGLEATAVATTAASAPVAHTLTLNFDRPACFVWAWQLDYDGSYGTGHYDTGVSQPGFTSWTLPNFSDGTHELGVIFCEAPMAIVIREDVAVHADLTLSIQSTEATRTLAINWGAQSGTFTTSGRLLLGVLANPSDDFDLLGVKVFKDISLVKLSPVSSRLAVGLAGDLWSDDGRYVSYSWGGRGLTADVSLPTATAPIRTFLTALPPASPSGLRAGSCWRIPDWSYWSYPFGALGGNECVQQTFAGRREFTRSVQSTMQPGLPMVLASTVDDGVHSSAPGFPNPADALDFYLDPASTLSGGRADGVLPSGASRWDLNVAPLTLPLTFRVAFEEYIYSSAWVVYASGDDDFWGDPCWRSQTLDCNSGEYTVGGGSERWAISNLSWGGQAVGYGPVELRATSPAFAVGPAQGSTLAVVNLDVSRTDPNPPMVSRFRIEQNGVRSAVLAPTAALIAFEVTDDVDVSSVTLEWKPSGSATWDALPLTRNGVEYSFVLSLAAVNGTVDLKLTASDASGNTISEGITPAFYVSGTPYGVAPGIVTPPASQVIQTGSTATLTVVTTGSLPMTFQWYQGASGVTTVPMSGATNSAFTTPPLTSTTSFWVRATNALGSVDSAAATVTVVAAGVLPAIVTQPADTFVHMGQSATLSVTATGQAPLAFQWYQGASGDTVAPIPGATASTYTTPPLSGKATYWVRVTNAFGSADSATATVYVASLAPLIVTQPASVSIDAGQSATLSVTATSSEPLSFQWYEGASGDTGAPISGATANTYTTPPLSATTSYWVRVTSAYGSADSATATVYVGTASSAPSIVSQPASQSIGAGETATLSVAVTGTAPLSFQWYQGSSGTTTSPIPGATASTYTTPPLNSTMSCWVRVTNAMGSADSATATVTVTSSPPKIMTQPASRSLVAGQTTTLAVVVSGTSPFTYQWYEGPSGVTSTPIPYATGSIYTSGPIRATTRCWVRVTNAFGSTDSATATLHVATSRNPRVKTSAQPPRDLRPAGPAFGGQPFGTTSPGAVKPNPGAASLREPEPEHSRWVRSGGFEPVSWLSPDGAVNGWRVDALGTSQGILQRLDPLDLTQTTNASLTLQSWLSSTASSAEIQYSVDGVTWHQLAALPPNAELQQVIVDLSVVSGQMVYVRMVFDPRPPEPGAAPDFWVIGGVRFDMSVGGGL